MDCGPGFVQNNKGISQCSVIISVEVPYHIFHSISKLGLVLVIFFCIVFVCLLLLFFVVVVVLCVCFVLF